MADSVGGVSASFTGDSSGLSKAVVDALNKLDMARAKAAQLSSALKDVSVTSNLSADGLRTLQSQADKAEKEIHQLTAASREQVTATANAVSSSTKGLSTARESIEKIRGAMGAVGQLADVSMSKFGALGGVIQNALGSFMTGGLVGVGIAALTSALALAANYWDVFGTKAETAAKKARQALLDTETKIISIRREIEALRGGGSVEEQTVRLEAEHLTAEQRAIETRAGKLGAGGGSIENTQELHNKGLKNPFAGAEKEFSEWQAVTKKLNSKMELLATMVDQQAAIVDKQNADEVAAKLKAEQEKLAAKVKENADAMASQSEATRIATEAMNRMGVSRDIFGMDLVAGRGVSPNPVDTGPGGYQQLHSPLLSMGDGVDAPELPGIEEMLASTKTVSDGMLKLSEPVVGASANLFRLSATLGTADESLGLMRLSMDESSISVRQSVNEMSEAMEQAAKDAKAFPVDMTETAKAGLQGGFEGAGAQLGAQLGSIVTASMGGADGGLGIIVGGLIGGILGEALDALIDVLGILTPLFDAVAVVIRQLNPIMDVLAVLCLDLAEVILALAPIVLAIAKPLAALILIYVRLFEVLLPIIVASFGIVAAFVGLADFFTMAVSWFDDVFFRPMAEGSAKVYNTFVSLVNSVVGWLRQVTGNDEFGVKLHRMSEHYDSILDKFAGSIEDAIDPPIPEDERRRRDGQGTDDAGDGGSSSFGESMTNVPSGYKRRLAELTYSLADADGPGGFGAMAGGGIVVNIANWQSRSSMSEDLNNIKRLAKNGTLAAQAATRTFNPDDRN